MSYKDVETFNAKIRRGIADQIDGLDDRRAVAYLRMKIARTFVNGRMSEDEHRDLHAKLDEQARRLDLAIEASLT